MQWQPTKLRRTQPPFLPDGDKALAWFRLHAGGLGLSPRPGSPGSLAWKLRADPSDRDGWHVAAGRASPLEYSQRSTFHWLSESVDRSRRGSRVSDGRSA